MIITKFGTMLITPGITIEIKQILKISFWPLNFNLVNANAANDAINIYKTVCVIETIKEFLIHVNKYGALSVIFAKFSNVKPAKNYPGPSNIWGILASFWNASKNPKNEGIKDNKVQIATKT